MENNIKAPKALGICQHSDTTFSARIILDKNQMVEFQSTSTSNELVLFDMNYQDFYTLAESLIQLGNQAQSLTGKEAVSTT